jgi:energy-coupling factor transporter ATP-binding protein EcfA2/cell fate (sporulation/competence/biofilm development) regulator YmcA (YheA/YmcA/DUF963 family)
MVVLLILGAVVAGGIWYYVSTQNKRRAQQARELAAAINDTYSYYGEMVTVEEVEEVLTETGSVSEAIAEIRHDIQKMAVKEPGIVVLGNRKGNARRGVELQEKVAEIEEEMSTTREFKQYRKEKPAIEARLEVWQEVVENQFPVFLPVKHRDRHTYVVGKSGSGKTTLLTWLASQDIDDDQGVAFLTPEAETIEEDLLPHIPSWRHEDVIYFNPADDRCRFSFNPLHRNPDEDIDRKVEAVFTSLTRLMESGSARINQILRQAIYALVELPETTLLDIPRLLDRDDPHYRKQVIARLEDEQTKQFWKTTYEELPANAHIPILTRLSKFIRPRRVRNVLCRPQQGLDFREIMDSGKILLCNLSDGLLGEDVSQLLGGLIMSELQLAAVGRADVPPEQRRRFYVYLDEFHSFTSHANVSYEKLLSRARKYRLPLTLAHQQTGQLSADLVREVFGNVSTLVSFLVSRRDASRISRECIRDDLPEYPTVDPDDLVTLDVGHAFAKVGTHAFPIRVAVTLEDFEADAEIKNQIIADSRRTSDDSGTAVSEDEYGKSSEPQKTDVDDESIPADPFADLTDPQDLY